MCKKSPIFAHNAATGVKTSHPISQNLTSANTTLKNMKIILNPKYEHLRGYLEHINEHFERDGHEIHRGRNVLRTLQTEGLVLCVKRYASPSLPGRLACKLYKTPKGKKAYLSPLLLRERGFESPEPIAFVKYSKGWFDSTTYFVCLHSSYKHSMADIMTLPAEEQDEVIQAFARHAARLHREGFLHRDFSAGNILFDKIKDRYRFTLIDTNSMKCGRPVSIEKGCANFARLAGDDDVLRKIALAYAAEQNADGEQCCTLILDAVRKYRSEKAQ